MTMENLSFDPVQDINTKLAEQYIKQKQKEFERGPSKDHCFVFNYNPTTEDKFEDDQWYSLFYPSGPHNKYNKALRDEPIDHKSRRKFCEKLNENLELFCQLEYLIRKNDVEDTKKQIKLILKYLECYDAWWQNEDQLPHSLLIVTEDTPLYYLGYAIGVGYCGKILRVFTTMKTAPLCRLFYEVCLHAGIYMYLAYISYWNVKDISNYCQIPESEGCTAVLTEYADVQSAVDVFLYSSPKAPWRIERLLVQESLYEELLSTLSAAGKGRRLEAEAERGRYVAAVATRRGTVALALGAAASDVVLLATYRTVRDLLALLAAPPAPRFLSLWCADSAQAHEIAAAAPVDYVWIDGYADFDGPPEAALAIYNARWCHALSNQFALTLPAPSANMWSALKTEERKSRVLETLDKFLLNNSNSTDDTAVLLNTYRSIVNWNPKDVVQVQSDKITVIVDYLERDVICFNTESFEYVLKLLVQGYSIAGTFLSTKENSALINALHQAGIPIIRLGNKISDYKSVSKRLHLGNKKVIQTSPGTMYAN